MTHRIEQVNATILRAVQQVLARGLNDPRVRGLITVTAVHCSPDLSQARVSISVLPAEHGELAMHGLRHAAKHIRTQVGRLIEIRRMPQLDFRLDESLKKAEAVYASLYRAGLDTERDKMKDDSSTATSPGDREPLGNLRGSVRADDRTDSADASDSDDLPDSDDPAGSNAPGNSGGRDTV